MKKTVPVVTVAEVSEAARVAELPLEATVALAEVADAIKDGLHAFASATGLVVMSQMMQAELTEAIGSKHAKLPAGERTGNWHGTTTGSVVLGGRLVKVDRPRARTTAGEEIGLDTWKAFSSVDLLNSLVVERMLAGVATRRHHHVAEPVGHEIESRSKGMSKSAISRRFVAATKQALAELMGRNLASFVTSKPAFSRVPGGLCTEGFDMIGTCENCGAPIRHLDQWDCPQCSPPTTKTCCRRPR